MKFLHILIIIFCLCNTKVFSQVDQPHKNYNYIGISAQVYPAGLITTFNFLKTINTSNFINLRIGGNFADRKDFSLYNDHEEGNGFGATIGYRRNIYLGRGYLTMGPNMDVWNMWINWENNIGESSYSFGTSYTLVIQPWLEFGYFIAIRRSPLQIGLSTGFGREINVITKGKKVGQGWMNSLLLSIQYSLK